MTSVFVLTNGPLAAADFGPSYSPMVRDVNTSLTIPFAEEGWPELLSETGAFKSLRTLEPETGILPYEPNLSFWSDYAQKSRWFYVPVGSTMGYSENGNWQFPGGSVWIKHFDMEVIRGDPRRKKKIETRFLVKNDFTIYGVSYRWNEEGTDATLVGQDGVSFDLSLFDGEDPITQTWSIPSRSDCLACHTSTAGFTLSFNTRQLNREIDIDSSLQNFLGYLSGSGYLDTELENPHTLPYFARPDDPSASLDFRARSYLAVNCVSCHQPGGTESDSFDARPQRALEFTNMIGGDPSIDNGDDTLRLIVRGDADKSLIYLRMLAQAGFDRMPAIATSEIDPIGSELIRNWIGNGLKDHQFYSEWREAVFGEVADTDGVPENDPDFDGDTNLAEFLNQTDPLSGVDRSSLQIAHQNGSLRIIFDGGQFADYQVETSPDLDNWQPLSEEAGGMLTVPEGGESIELVLQPEGLPVLNQFFRVTAKQR